MKRAILSKSSFDADNHNYLKEQVVKDDDYFESKMGKILKKIKKPNKKAKKSVGKKQLLLPSMCLEMCSQDKKIMCLIRDRASGLEIAKMARCIDMTRAINIIAKTPKKTRDLMNSPAWKMIDREVLDMKYNKISWSPVKFMDSCINMKLNDHLALYPLIVSASKCIVSRIHVLGNCDDILRRATYESIYKNKTEGSTLDLIGEETDKKFTIPEDDSDKESDDSGDSSDDLDVSEDEDEDEDDDEDDEDDEEEEDDSEDDD